METIWSDYDGRRADRRHVCRVFSIRICRKCAGEEEETEAETEKRVTLNIAGGKKDDASAEEATDVCDRDGN